MKIQRKFTFDYISLKIAHIILNTPLMKMNHLEIPDGSLVVLLIIIFEEFLHKVDMFIRHLCDGVSIRAVEVNEPYL